ncbi:type II secretion system minor pseudopilin GspH [Legionella gresilensis]|uniref:type II secretion system minor pseudopilin GspH n=1 Tax=Legionella gresilensis TaxID=91823 RepID=UPI0010412519|nr:type II secretion system minor pseudopilin GspH [Legionella gresilensis]
MQKLVTGTQNERGFTLIEILVVILIIGIIASVALFAFGDFGTSRRIKLTAEQFSAYLKLVQQRAILEMVTLGVTINNEGYETYRHSNNSWQSMPKNSLIFHRFFPKDTVITLKAQLKNNIGPNIIITPSGSMTEFTLIFGTSAEPNIITLIGKHNGALTFDNQKMK